MVINADNVKQAITAVNIAKIKELLAQGLDVTRPLEEYSSETPLSLAALLNDDAIIEALISEQNQTGSLSADNEVVDIEIDDAIFRREELFKLLYNNVSKDKLATEIMLPVFKRLFDQYATDSQYEIGKGLLQDLPLPVLFKSIPIDNDEWLGGSIIQHCMRRAVRSDDFSTVRSLLNQPANFPDIWVENYAIMIRVGLLEAIDRLNQGNDVRKIVEHLLDTWETSPIIARYHQKQGGNAWELQGMLLKLIITPANATPAHLTMEKEIIEILLQYGAAKNQVYASQVIGKTIDDQSTPTQAAILTLDHPDFTTCFDPQLLGKFKNKPELIGKLLPKTDPMGEYNPMDGSGYSTTTALHLCNTKEQLALLLAVCEKPKEAVAITAYGARTPIACLKANGNISTDEATLTKQVLELADHYRLAHHSLGLSFAEISVLQSQNVDFKKLTDQYANSVINTALKNYGIPIEAQETLAQYLSAADIHKLAHTSKAVAHESKLGVMAVETISPAPQPASPELSAERKQWAADHSDFKQRLAKESELSRRAMDNLVDRGDYNADPKEGEESKSKDSWVAKYVAEKYPSTESKSPKGNSRTS